MLIQGHFGTTLPVKWPIQLHHETPNHHSRRIEWVNRYFLNHYRLKMQWNSKNVHFRATMLVQGRVGAQIFIIDHFWLHHRIPHPQIALEPAQPEKNSTTSHSSSFLKYAIMDSVSNKEVAIPKQAKYVIDGGALLNRIPWTRGATFSSILDSHTQYVLKKYGKAIIVFDG